MEYKVVVYIHYVVHSIFMAYSPPIAGWCLKQHQSYCSTHPLLVTSISLSVFCEFDFLDFTSKWYHIVLVFLCWASFTQHKVNVCSRSVCVVAKDKMLFLLVAEIHIYICMYMYIYNLISFNIFQLLVSDFEPFTFIVITIIFGFISTTSSCMSYFTCFPFLLPYVWLLMFCSFRFPSSASIISPICCVYWLPFHDTVWEFTFFGEVFVFFSLALCSSLCVCVRAHVCCFHSALLAPI